MIKYRSIVFIILALILNCTPKTVPQAAPTAETKPAARPDGLSALVNTSGVNIRKAPEKNSTVLGTLNQGDIVILIDRSAEQETIYKCPKYWFKIKFNNSTGWVYGEFLHDFLETRRQIETFHRSPRKYAITLPSSWNFGSTIDDYSGAKMAEVHYEQNFSGEFSKHLKAQLKALSGGEFPMILKSLNVFTHGKMKTYKAIIETGYEGACPVSTGTWYLVEYYFLFEPNAYLPVVFFKRQSADDQSERLFDEIASTIRLQ